MTTNCTGQRYQGENSNLAAIPNWHGKYGHVNVLQLDHDSACTGYGAHDRVVAFCADTDGLYCRIDHVWNLGMPSPYQIIRAANAQNGTKGHKWQVSKFEQGEKSSHIYFTRK